MSKLDLKEEIRSDYKVTTERKKLWAVELDILEKIIAICEKHNIKYCAAGGTMLGAVRHKGFIPWDDDIDIAMTREDYEKFLRFAEKELKEPYCLITSLNDKRFLPHAQIQNLNTTAMIPEKDAKMGIFVDIFPFDKVPESGFRRKLHRMHLRIKWKYLRAYYLTDQKSDNFSGSIFKTFVRITKNIRKPFSELYKDYKKLATKYNKSNSKLISSPEFLSCYEGDITNDGDYSDLIDMKFEYLTIKVPREYDKILRKHYGNNYMKPIKGTQVHDISMFDPNKSYKEYLKAKES